MSSTFVVSADPAQRTQVLVSNIGQHPASSQGVASLDVAQGFTTGRSPRGYTLTSIEVQITSAGVIDSAVVRKTDPNTGELVATLTGPSLRRRWRKQHCRNRGSNIHRAERRQP